jgi:endonuclease YncB( thermonuclease family)
MPFTCTRALLALTVCLLLAWPGHADPTILTGTVTHVRDGDTIEVGKIPIRLNGVSAPELDEPLGQQSKQFMRDLVDGKSVRCELNGKKTYDRFVGVCYLDGKDIGVSVIEAGLALDCPKFSGGRYKAVEAVAAREAITLPGYCR